MLKSLAIAAAVGLLTVTQAQAVCPSIVPGSSAEAIRANGERLLCLQRESAELFDDQKTQFDVMMLERSVQNLQLQRRFDQLPRVQPYTPLP